MFFVPKDMDHKYVVYTRWIMYTQLKHTVVSIIVVAIVYSQ